MATGNVQLDFIIGHPIPASLAPAKPVTPKLIRDARFDRSTGAMIGTVTLEFRDGSGVYLEAEDCACDIKGPSPFEVCTVRTVGGRYKDSVASIASAIWDPGPSPPARPPLDIMLEPTSIGRFSERPHRPQLILSLDYAGFAVSWNLTPECSDLICVDPVQLSHVAGSPRRALEMIDRALAALQHTRAQLQREQQIKENPRPRNTHPDLINEDIPF